jgi:hypothetical protein
MKKLSKVLWKRENLSLYSSLLNLPTILQYTCYSENTHLLFFHSKMKTQILFWLPSFYGCLDLLLILGVMISLTIVSCLGKTWCSCTSGQNRPLNRERLSCVCKDIQEMMVAAKHTPITINKEHVDAITIVHTLTCHNWLEWHLPNLNNMFLLVFTCKN